MQLSETVKLYMSKTEYQLVKDTMDTYIATVNPNCGAKMNKEDGE